MIDSHCHLADEAFDADLGAAVARARDAGVRRGLCIVSVGDVAEAARAGRVATTWPEAVFAVGAHPHGARAFMGRAEEAATLIRRALESDHRVRAIGEIGLDYYYDLSPPDVQQDVFRAQVRLARETGRPLVIHSREADEDTIRILREEGQGAVGGVFHCFSGSAALADAALQLGFHVSFAGILTFPRADGVRAVARTVPLDRLLVETDCPYLAPLPHRGRRNEPAWVVQVAEKLAEVQGVTLGALDEAVSGNFTRLFGP